MSKFKEKVKYEVKRFEVLQRSKTYYLLGVSLTPAYDWLSFILLQFKRK